jgi:hypothetical protein
VLVSFRVLYPDGVTIVSSEDLGKSDDRWKSYTEYEAHGSNQVSLERNMFRWKDSGVVSCVANYDMMRNQVSLEGFRCC